MSKQIAKIAMMLVLAVGLTAGAAAQNKDGGFSPVGIYTGVETAQGTLEPFSAIRYGDTFVLNSFGEWESHHLTVSLNYSESGDENDFVVTGGTWSLVVIRENQYAGTVYGEVTDGSIQRVTNRNGQDGYRQMQIELKATGGLGMFAGRESQNITGVLNLIADFPSNQTVGNASFNF